MKKTILAFLLSIFILQFQSFGQSIDGTYDREDGNGDVTFKTVKRGTNFMIVVVGEQPGTCIGEAKGQLEWLNKDVAIVSETKYDGDDEYVLILAMVFSGNQVKIRELKGEAFHGANCNFEGIYKKRGKK